jgi:hypothetical protein
MFAKLLYNWFIKIATQIKDTTQINKLTESIKNQIKKLLDMFKN